MDRAYLAADYHDAGANRVVSVLESLREGFLRKAAQAEIISRAEDKDIALAARSMAKTYRIVVDDLATFIMREQRRD